MHTFPRIAALILFLSPSIAFGENDKKQNIAVPEKHPYVDVSGGRDSYLFSGETVNEARLYDFYQRQADYYLSSANEIPEILPAYPGLDGGLHGHWGKHNQNNHIDTRWNDAEMGEVITQVLRKDKASVLKGICVRLGEDRALSTCFDPMSLSYRSIWEGGFVSFDGFRWGTSRNAQIDGKSWFFAETAEMPEDAVYLGYRRFGKRVVFQYKLGDTEVDDEPWSVGNSFYRQITFKNSASMVKIPISPGEEANVQKIASVDASSEFDQKSGTLKITDAKANAKITIRLSKESTGTFDEAALAHFSKEKKQSRRWPETITTAGSPGEPRGNSAYLVDTLTAPYENPWNVVMQLSGIAFLPDGSAIVSTLVGDIWHVSGFEKSLKKIEWRRFATGFNQPVGIHTDEDGIFVLDRGQIYRLHDENGDGEVDFYENYANDFGGYDRSHSHTFGLHRTADGAFHFTQRESILRTSPDRTTTLQASGVRNCMGIGGSDDYFWVAPQEGSWTPTSSIIEVNRGEFYGLPNKDNAGGTIATPLCFIPRGVENSTGGMVEITSAQWGPFQGQHVGLSYGSGVHYLILRDEKGSRPQGAVVPLEGEFLSGSMRGDFHPGDGQLYLVGLDGWGDYSLRDGCFHRVRYSGETVYKPSGFQVHENGIKIKFPTKLDPETAEDISHYFAHSWNYEYAKRYGSPEFSARNPASLGHDPVEVRSVTLLEEDKSLFVEMPSMEPVMQLHLRMHLKASDGHEFKTDLFASPMYPSSHFSYEGLEAPRKGKPDAITLRVQRGKEDSAKFSESGEITEGERSIATDAIGGLQYAQKLLEAKPNEALAWKLRNTDVMPHNLVLVKPGSMQSVGEASFQMLNDPKAGEKHYVPDSTEVIAYIPVINPGAEHILHFRAPAEPGDYPYICTFPGHWMAMNGILRVK